MNAQIVKIADAYCVSGSMTVKTTPALFGQIVAFDQGMVIDLQDVDQIDSAGLALLIYWQTLAQSNGIHLVYRNVPSNLQKLAAICSAESLFPA